MAAPLLEIRGLKTHFATDDGIVQAVDGVDISIGRGETLGVVGESGCGKTVTALSVLKLIAMPPGEIVAGQILYQGRDLAPLGTAEMDRIRAKDIAMVFQEQILELLQDMKSRFGMAIMLITHAMGVVAETAQRVVVMYAGKVIEEAPVERLFADPKHPYTQGLIRSIPRIDTAATRKARLEAIPGVVPSLLNPPPGCRFAAACRYALAKCRAAAPPLIDTGGGHKVACVLVQDELVPAQ